MKAKKKSVSLQPKKLIVPVNLANDPENILYETDFYKWTKQQAAIIRRMDYAKLDPVNLSEEIESLGRSERRAIRSHLIVLMQHLLKLNIQKKRATKSWERSIANAKREIYLILEDSLSLKREIPEMIESSFKYAREKAITETRMEEKLFPKKCPWKISDLL